MTVPVKFTEAGITRATKAAIRAAKVAREDGLPVTRVTVEPDGGLSIFLADASQNINPADLLED